MLGQCKKKTQRKKENNTDTHAHGRELFRLTRHPPLKVHFPIHSGEFAALHIRLLGIRKLRALSFKLFQRLQRKSPFGAKFVSYYNSIFFLYPRFKLDSLIKAPNKITAEFAIHSASNVLKN